MLWLNKVGRNPTTAAQTDPHMFVHAVSIDWTDAFWYHWQLSRNDSSIQMCPIGSEIIWWLLLYTLLMYYYRVDDYPNDNSLNDRQEDYIDTFTALQLEDYFE